MDPTHLKGVELQQHNHLHGGGHELEAAVGDRGPAVQRPVQLPGTLILVQTILMHCTMDIHECQTPAKAIGQNRHNFNQKQRLSITSTAVPYQLYT